MSALFQRLLPLFACDHSTKMRGVEQDIGPDLVGDRPDFADRVAPQVEAAADRDQLGTHTLRKLGERANIDREIFGVDGSGMHFEPIKAGRAGAMMCDMPADRIGRSDDGIARLARRHERVEIGHRARCQTKFDKTRTKHFGRNFGRERFDLLDRLKAHFIFGAGIAKRRAAAETAGEKLLGARIHHICRGVQINRSDIVDLPVLLDQLEQPAVDGIDRPIRHCRGDALHQILAFVANP